MDAEKQPGAQHDDGQPQSQTVGPGSGDDAVLAPEGGPAVDGQGPPDEGPGMSRGAAWLAMAAVAVALLLVYLAPGVTTPLHDDDEDHAADAALVGMDAPLHFTLKDMNGVDVKLESFRGKIIFLNFWATWCPPCKVEIPDLIQLQTKYSDDVVILGVSIDDTAEQLKPFAAEYRVNYPLLIGNGREDVQDAFGPMWALPSTAIIGRDGKIARKHTGIRTKEQFENEIKALL
jgi:cytochrome c biogenesis protein CcmG/thiol:disulfide interchange protein DsbE